MRDLGVLDLRALNESVLILNSTRRQESLAERLASALSYLIRFDLAAVECFDNAGVWVERLLGDSDGLIEKHFAAFHRLGTTHPLFPAFLSGHLQRDALRISDVMSRSHLYELELYDQFLRPIGVDVQMGVSVACSDGSSDVLILSRKGIDFNSSEKNRLAAFLPHIANARRYAVQEMKSRNSSTQVFRNSRDKNYLIEHLQRSMGLTNRESEIVWYLTCGQCDKDIASVCRISQRTVQKHCENIYRKTAFEGRTAIVAAALNCDR